jgi:MFS family permease
MAIYHLLPDVFVGEPAPDEHPFAKMRRGQAQGYVQLSIWGATPAVAALVGGGLALRWSIAIAVWRSIANRKPRE